MMQLQSRKWVDRVVWRKKNVSKCFSIILKQGAEKFAERIEILDKILWEQVVGAKILQ